MKLTFTTRKESLVADENPVCAVTLNTKGSCLGLMASRKFGFNLYGSYCTVRSAGYVEFAHIGPLVYFRVT
jgi:hypothetical protein